MQSTKEGGGAKHELMEDTNDKGLVVEQAVRQEGADKFQP